MNTAVTAAEVAEDRAPVTLSLVAKISAVLMIAGPLVWWAASLQVLATSTAAEVAVVKVEGSSELHKRFFELSTRQVRTESEVRLRGEQLDRMEGYLQELLRRSR